MNPRHAICLVVDGLRASALGAYGNTSFPTPHLDALASRALVADWLWADSPCLDRFYRGVWQGLHALRPATAQASVLESLQNASVQQWLVTDEAWLIEQSGQLPFNKTLLFENEAEESADWLEATTLGRFFSEVVENLAQWREEIADASSLAWLHCRGLYGSWDAPYGLRDDLLDEEDPLADDFVQPPIAMHQVSDPDVLLMHRIAYAAQITVLDACLGAFLAALQEIFPADDTLFMLSGSRGFALGEHGSIGTDCAELYSERLHLPWLLYPCGNAIPLPRLRSFAQPTDIGATLLDWLQVNDQQQHNDGISWLSALQGTPSQSRRMVVSAAENEAMILTPAWMMRKIAHDDDSSTQLFTKPDDRWECNDVADRCPEVVEELAQELAAYQQNCLNDQPLPLAPQNHELTELLR